MRKTWKRALAMVCTAAMVVTGVNWPTMNAEAAEYNTKVRESGYKKATITSATSGCGWSEGDYSALYDENVNTHWHSHYAGGSGEGTPIGDTTTSTGNWVSVTLKEATDVAGVVYVPRQHSAGADANGTFKMFKVMVSTSETEDNWTEVDIAEVNGEAAETFAYSGDSTGYYVTVKYTLDNASNFANEQELIFKNVQNNVKRVKFVAKETNGGQKNQFMNAAELCVERNIYR